MIKRITTDEFASVASTLNAGDEVLFSGTVYTARDAAHKRIFDLMQNGASLPFDLRGAVIYYAGPTPAPDGRVIGSCGPTTSSRMDVYAPRLYDEGVAATIGKGPRSREVIESIVRNGAVYFIALGGIGALAAERVTECEVIAFDDLGCESVKRLRFCDFPLYVGVDPRGNSILK